MRATGEEFFFFTQKLALFYCVRGCDLICRETRCLRCLPMCIPSLLFVILFFPASSSASFMLFSSLDIKQLVKFDAEKASRARERVDYHLLQVCIATFKRFLFRRRSGIMLLMALCSVSSFLFFAVPVFVAHFLPRLRGTERSAGRVLRVD